MTTKVKADPCNLCHGTGKTDWMLRGVRTPRKCRRCGGTGSEPAAKPS